MAGEEGGNTKDNKEAEQVERSGSSEGQEDAGEPHREPV